MWDINFITVTDGILSSKSIVQSNGVLQAAMGNSMSPSDRASENSDDLPNPQCLASNNFTDESSEEELDWNPCCPERERLSLVKMIEDMVTYVGGIFVSKEIQDVMKTVIREHFVYNTGVRVRSVHYNVGEVEDEDNRFHVCFAPRRELGCRTNFVEFLEKLKFSRGHFFLHLGSGTGYLSTLAGLLIGASGVNHGVEVNPDMLAYAEERQNAFRDHCVDLQKFEYCEPLFILGDCLKLEGDIRLYDRIFCSGMLPAGYENLLKLHLKDNGVLIFPRTNRILVSVKRVGKEQFDTEEHNTSRPMDFYHFVSTSQDLPTVLPDELIPSLQELSRGIIRQHIRSVQQAPSVRKRDRNDSSSGPPRKRRNLSRRRPCTSSSSDDIVDPNIIVVSPSDPNSPQQSDNMDTSVIPSSDNPQMEAPSSLNNEAVQNSPVLAVQESSNSPQEDQNSLVYTVLEASNSSVNMNSPVSSVQEGSNSRVNRPQEDQNSPVYTVLEASNSSVNMNSPVSSVQEGSNSRVNVNRPQEDQNSPAPTVQESSNSHVNMNSPQEDQNSPAPTVQESSNSHSNSPEEDGEAVQNSPAPAVQEDSNSYRNIPQEDGNDSDSSDTLSSSASFGMMSPLNLEPMRLNGEISNTDARFLTSLSRRHEIEAVRSTDSDLDDLFASDSEAEYCSECELELEKSVPQKVKPYNPNEIYPPSALNTKINSLPLPKYLKWYLKYKHNLVVPQQPTDPYSVPME